MELSGAGITEVVHLLSRGRDLAVQSANATQIPKHVQRCKRNCLKFYPIDNIANTTIQATERNIWRLDH